MKGLQREVKHESYARAASTSTSTSSSRRSSYPSVVLERGLALDDLWKWALDASKGDVAAQDVWIRLQNEAGEKAWAWQLDWALPVKWRAPISTRTSSQVVDGEPRARASRAEEGDMRPARAPRSRAARADRPRRVGGAARLPRDRVEAGAADAGRRRARSQAAARWPVPPRSVTSTCRSTRSRSARQLRVHRLLRVDRCQRAPPIERAHDCARRQTSEIARHCRRYCALISR